MLAGFGQQQFGEHQQGRRIRFAKRFGENWIPIWPYGLPSFKGAFFVVGTAFDRGQTEPKKRYLSDIGDSGGAFFARGALSGVTIGGDHVGSLGFSAYEFDGGEFTIAADLSSKEATQLLNKIRGK